MATENALYTILTEKIKQGSLILPTLPEVALKVRTAADDPEITLNMMSDIIAKDPALSLGMIKVANSAILGRTVKVETVSQAVTRIGLRQIKSIATAMALEQIFISNNDIVAQYMEKSWAKTIDIAAVAIALMDRFIKIYKSTPLSLDNITLAALIHNIGVLPILTEAERHPEVFANPEFLQQAIIKLSGPIGGQICRSWGFSESFIMLTEQWSDLSYLPKEPHYVDFIRSGALYHKVFKSESTKEALLANYAKKGVLADVDYLDSEEFIEKYESAKSMFL